MTVTTYNGWTNYATWRVNLEIFDGYDASDLPRDPFDAAAALRDMAEELICGQAAGDESSLARDYALAFLADVNWREIAAHMLEGVE
jgi:hypothetical protein